MEALESGRREMRLAMSGQKGEVVEADSKVACADFGGVRSGSPLNGSGRDAFAEQISGCHPDWGSPCTSSR